MTTSAAKTRATTRSRRSPDVRRPCALLVVVALLIAGVTACTGGGATDGESATTLTAGASEAAQPTVSATPDEQVQSTGSAAPDEPDALAGLASDAAPDVRIAVAGDVGTGDVEERRTAAAMALLEDDHPFDALLLLGDNVYPSGDPAQLPDTVFNPFADVLDVGTDLIAVLGNHDVEEGNGDAHARAIGMPSRWYQQEVGDVTIVALDSTQPDDVEQQQWLAGTLAAIDTGWVIAIMHHPPYSAGEHGSSLDVREAFTPLFEQYDVDLVLAGHDHDYQRSSQINGVTYVVSGGAAKLRDAGWEDFTEVSLSIRHFLDVAVWEDRMEVRAIGQDGDVLDELILTAR